MDCIIPGGNLKVIGKVLQTLMKIGSELYIEAKKDYLQFATINMNKTSFCKFNFQPTFFTSYNVNDKDLNEENKAVTCKLLIKSVFNIFKSKTPKEKKVEYCKIELDVDATKIIFKLKYKHDIVIVHSLRLIDMEFVTVTYDRDTLENEISATGTFFGQILANFQTGDEDMTLEVKEHAMLVRNYDTNSTNVGKNIRSQVALQVSEFLYYNIRKETTITMCFKPFRAAVHFCEGFNLNVTLNFDSGGKPVMLKITNPTFEADFILSTINPEGETQSCATSTTSVPKNAKKTHELTVQDKSMLDSLNWDSDFETNEDIFQMKANNNKGVARTTELNGKSDENVIPDSPESPRSKRIRLVFGRCLENTISLSQMDFGEVLAPNSDTE